jgi:Rv0078B-related antitoxin
MELIRDPEVMARVQLMFDLYEFAEAVMRQNLRRWFPQESETELEQRLAAWVRKDPGYDRTPLQPAVEHARHPE